jgi:hypothetical protein
MEEINVVGETEKYSAQSVSAMEAVRVNAIVSAEYMAKRISKKRKRRNAVPAKEKKWY